MPELLDIIESYTSDNASTGTLFNGDGQNVHRGVSRVSEAAYMQGVKIIAETFKGSRRAAMQFQEAMTTSDFPLIFGDTIDRLLLANYEAHPDRKSTRLNSSH